VRRRRRAARHGRPPGRRRRRRRLQLEIQEPRHERRGAADAQQLRDAASAEAELKVHRPRDARGRERLRARDAARAQFGGRVAARLHDRRRRRVDGGVRGVEREVAQRARVRLGRGGVERQARGGAVQRERERKVLLGRRGGEEGREAGQVPAQREHGLDERTRGGVAPEVARGRPG
jgi:hypothetical protein